MCARLVSCRRLGPTTLCVLLQVYGGAWRSGCDIPASIVAITGFTEITDVQLGGNISFPRGPPNLPPFGRNTSRTPLATRRRGRRRDGF